MKQEEMYFVFYYFIEKLIRNISKQTY